MRLPKLKLRLKLPFKLPKFTKQQQDVLEKAVPVLTNIAVDVVQKELVKPKDAPKRTAVWYLKLALLCGLALSPVFIDAFPDQQWDDNAAAAIAIIAALFGVKHVKNGTAK